MIFMVGLFCLNKSGFGPAFGGPMEGPNGEGGSAVASAIVEVATQPLGAAVVEEPCVSGSNERAGGFHKESAPVSSQVESIFIQVWSRNLFAAAHANIVSAIHTTATSAPIDKEIIFSIVPIDRRRFNRLVARQGIHG